jgi:5'-deoxynucleotidase YfbR-like HD superfamily hydrolase
MICLEDIAYALSNIVRFGGQMDCAYTVAQHSVLVAMLAPDDLKFEALMHDAAEAYIGDVIKPLKVMLGESYASIERKMEAAIFSHFNISSERVKLVKPYDIEAIEIENGLRYNSQQYPVSRYMNIFGTTVWSHKKAYNMFYEFFVNCSELRKQKCTECNGTGNASIERDTAFIPCIFCDASGTIS